jgi:hypothetical protein
LDERLFVRFPAIYRLFAERVLRLPAPFANDTDIKTVCVTDPSA